MSNEKVVNNRKVTDMLKKMLQLGDAFVVDINNMVHYVTTPDEPIYVPVNNKLKKKLYIYSTDIKDPDALIINPLSETLSGGAERLIFYSSLSHVLSQWLYRILNLIVEESAKQKNVDKNEIDPKILTILTPFIDRIDEKTPAELERLKNAGLKDFCNIYYNRTKKKSTLLMGFEDETGDYIKSNSKIRKKSWEVFTDICKYILEVPKEEKIKDVYTASTEKIEFPQFTTFSSVWIRAWEKLNKYLDWFDNHHTDDDLITSLKEHINNAPIYRECVTWLKQPTSISMSAFDAGLQETPKEVSNATPEAVPTQTVQQPQQPSWMRTRPAVVPSPIPVQTQPRPSWMTGNNTNPQFYNSGYNQQFVNTTQVPSVINNYGFNNNNSWRTPW